MASLSKALKAPGAALLALALGAPATGLLAQPAEDPNLLGQPRINEFIITHAGDGVDTPANTYQQIEILDPARPSHNYDGSEDLWIVFIEGNVAQGPGEVQFLQRVEGVMSDADGFVCIGPMDGAMTASEFPGTYPNGVNDSITILLVTGMDLNAFPDLVDGAPSTPAEGTVGGAIGEDLDTNNAFTNVPTQRGDLEITPWTTVLDQVARYGPSKFDIRYSNIILAPGFDQNFTTVAGASRIADDDGLYEAGDWIRNNFAGSGFEDPTTNDGDYAGITAAAGEAFNTICGENAATLGAILLSDNCIDENSPAGTLIGRLSVEDPEMSGDYIWEITRVEVGNMFMSPAQDLTPPRPRFGADNIDAGGAVAGVDTGGDNDIFELANPLPNTADPSLPADNADDTLIVETVDLVAGDNPMFDADMPFPPGDDMIQVRVRVTDADNPKRTIAANFTIEIKQVDEPPTAVDDTGDVDEGAAFDSTVDMLNGGADPNVLANDTDPEMGALTASLVPGSSPASAAAFNFNPDGTFTYTHNGDDPPPGGVVTFQYTASDGTFTSAPATVTITINPINDPPALDLNPDSLPAGTGTSPNFVTTFTENGAAVRIADTDVSVTDGDSPALLSMTLVVDVNPDGADDIITLGGIDFPLNADLMNQAPVVGGTTFDIDYTSGTRTFVVNVTAGGAPADFQALLDGGTYRNTSENPTQVDRVITMQVNDGAGAMNLSNMATATISVVADNDPPVLDLDDVEAGVDNTNLAFTEDTTPTDLGMDAAEGNATVTDAEGDMITGGTAVITAGGTDNDLLTATDMGAVTSSYDRATRTLTLTGTDTTATYQAVIRSVQYHNTSENPDTTTREVTFVVTDNNSTASANGPQDSAPAVATITVARNNDAPVLDLDGAASILFIGNAATPTSFADGAVFAFLEGRYGVGNVTYRQATGALTGDEATFDAIVISSTPGSNNIRNAGYNALAVPILNYEEAVMDDEGGEFQQTTGIMGKSNNTTEVTVVGQHPITAGPELTGTVAFVTSGETLFTTNTVFGTVVGIGGNGDALGSPSLFVAEVGDLLADGTMAPGRRVAFPITDSTFNTLTAQGRQLFGQAVDWLVAASPTGPGVDNTVAFVEDAGAVVLADTDSILQDAENDGIITGGTAVISTAHVDPEDVLSAVDQGGVTAAYDGPTGTLTFTGAAPLSTYLAVVRSVTYNNTSDTPDTTTRTVTFTLTDDNANGGANGMEMTTAEVDITVMAVNDPPVAVDDTADAEEGPLVFNDSEGAAASGGNDTSGTAGNLSLLVPTTTPYLINGNISTADANDVDFYTFTLRDPMTDVVFDIDLADDRGNVANNDDFLDARLTLFDDTLAIIETNDNTGGDEGSLPFGDLDPAISRTGGMALPAGRYFIAVSSSGNMPMAGGGFDNGGVAGEVGAYALFITDGAISDRLFFSSLAAGADPQLNGDTDDSVLDNDTDAEMDALTAVLDTGPANAALFVLLADGRFFYVHDGIDPPGATDSFTYTADDGMDPSATAATVTINLTAVNDPPIIDLDANNSDDATLTVDFQTMFDEGDLPVGITDVDITVTDTDDTALVRSDWTVTGVVENAEEVITIAGEPFPLNADKTFTTGTIGGTAFDIVYTTAGQTFAITVNAAPPGGGAPADFRTLIGGSTYQHNGEDPTDGDREIAFTVGDDEPSTSGIAVATITVAATNDRPIVNLDPDNNSGAGPRDFTTTLKENMGPVEIADDAVTITDADGTTLISMVIVVNAVPNVNLESLTVVGPGTVINLSADFATTNIGMVGGGGTDFDVTYVAATRTLTVTPNGGGSAPIADWILLLDALAYNNTSENPTAAPARTFTVTVNDGSLATFTNDPPAVATVNITPVNDASVVDLDVGDDTADGANYAAVYTENDPPLDIQHDASITDVDNTTLQSMSWLVGGVLDGGSEVVNILGIDFPLNADSSATVDLGGANTFDVNFSAGTGGGFYAQNFDAFGDGTTNLGDGSTIGSNNGPASVQGRALRMTSDTVNATLSSFRIPPVPGSSNGWTATFDFTLIDAPGESDPADGFSFNYGAIPPLTANDNSAAGHGTGEEGFGTFPASVSPNVSVEFDTWRVGDGEHGYNVAVDGVDVAGGFVNTDIVTDGGTVNGSATITWDQASDTLTLVVDTGCGPVTIFNAVSTAGFVGDDAFIFAFSARTGGADEDLFIDNLQIVATGAPAFTITPNASAGTLGDFAGVIEGATYRHTSENPTDGDRLFSLSVNDGSAISSIALATIDVDPVNDPPVVDLDENPATAGSPPAPPAGPGFMTTFTENVDTDVPIQDDAVVFDFDSTTLASMTWEVGGLVAMDAGSEILEVAGTDYTLNASLTTNGVVVGGTTFNVVYVVGTTTFTITATAGGGLADFETLIEGARYRHTSEDPTPGNRTVDIILNDGAGANNLSAAARATIEVIAVNDLPVVDLDSSTPAGDPPTDINFSTTFTEDMAAVAVTSVSSVTDADDTELMAINLGFGGTVADGDDEILEIGGTDFPLATATGAVAVAGGDFTVQVFTADNIDILPVGMRTFVEWQNLLDGIEYRNLNQDPDDSNRVLTFDATDATGGSNTPDAVCTIMVVKEDDAPDLFLDADLFTGIGPENAQATFTQGGGPVLITGGADMDGAGTPDVVITDDDDTNMEGADIYIVGGAPDDAPNEILAASVVGTSITATYNPVTGVLELRGSDIIANYETVIASVTYDNIDPLPTGTTRTVEFVVFDGSIPDATPSPTRTSTVEVDVELDAIDDTVVTGVNIDVTIPVLGNDLLGNQPTVITEINGMPVANDGDMVNVGDGNVVTLVRDPDPMVDDQLFFNPFDTFTGCAQFTYTIRDTDLDTDTATVSVGVSNFPAARQYSLANFDGGNSDGTGLDGYVTGIALRVDLTIQPLPDTTFWGVTDTIPAGWTAGDFLIDGQPAGGQGSLNETNNTVTFGIFTDVPASRTVSYFLQAPPGETLPVQPDGQVFFEKGDGGFLCSDPVKPSTLPTIAFAASPAAAGGALPTDDTNGDSIVNLCDYAFGVDPAAGGYVITDHVVAKRVDINGIDDANGAYLALVYSRAMNVEGLEFIVEGSTDGTVWAAEPGVHRVQSDDGTRWKIIFKTLIGNRTSLMLRLKIVQGADEATHDPNTP